MSPTPAEARPPTDRDFRTEELPPLPQRDYLIPVERWVDAPETARALGADFGITLVAYKRRIGDFLLWRAGPAKGANARYLALRANDLREQYTFTLDPSGRGTGLGPDAATHERFRTWKEALLAASERRERES